MTARCWALDGRYRVAVFDGITYPPGRKGDEFPMGAVPRVARALRRDAILRRY